MYPGLLLPKITEIIDLPVFVQQMYLRSRSNDVIDPIWEGIAVVFNDGANSYIEEHGKDSGWFCSFQAE